MATVHPFLWFNLDAEAARDFYLSVFKNSRALETIEFTDKPHAIFDFELEGLRLTALNAGGVPPFNERISLYRNQGPGRDRLLLECAGRRRRLGTALRLAEGQVRRLLAGHPQ